MRNLKIVSILIMIFYLVACAKENNEPEIADLKCNVKKISTGLPWPSGALFYDEVWEFNEARLILLHKTKTREDKYKYDLGSYRVTFNTNDGEWHSGGGGTKEILYNGYGVLQFVPTLEEYENQIGHKWEYAREENGSKVYSYEIVSNLWVTIEIRIDKNGYVQKTAWYNSRAKGGEPITSKEFREYVYEYWD